MENLSGWVSSVGGTRCERGLRSSAEGLEALAGAEHQRVVIVDGDVVRAEVVKSAVAVAGTALQPPVVLTR